MCLPLLAGCAKTTTLMKQRTSAPPGDIMAELQGSDTVAGDYFDASVAMTSNTALVRAWGHDNYAGRVYVFSRMPSGWFQTAELTGSDTVAGDSFGYSVAISGSTAIVGAQRHDDLAGRAYVFNKTSSGWVQTTELKGSDTAAGDYFGGSVALAGNTAVVGARDHANYAGRAYVSTRTRSGWTQTPNWSAPTLSRATTSARQWRSREARYS